MKPCLHCEDLTFSECVCGHAYCHVCQDLFGSTLCPMCVRLSSIRHEQAMWKRLVPWQVITDHGAITIKVEAW